MKNKQIVLASASPRRKELFKNITEDFSVLVSDVEEIVPDNLKDEEIPIPEKEEITQIDEKIAKLSADKKVILEAFAAEEKTVRQLIDLALLSNNMLKGEALAQFVKRSIEMIK